MNIIYYFTATGNCLHTSQKVAELLPETKLVRITDNTQPVEGNFDRIGFIYPVYVAIIPKMVQHFIENIEMQKNTYIFGIAVHGGVKGISNIQVASIFQKKGIHNYQLFNSKTVHNGYFVSKPLTNEEQIKAVDKSDNKVNNIAKKINEKKSQTQKNALMKNKLIKLIFNSDKIISDPRVLSKGMKVNKNCIGCGICPKVCPADNIRIVDGTAVLADKCEVCFACIHWCPNKALQFDHPTMKGKTTKGKGQYHNYQVQLKDVIREDIDGL